MPQANIGLIGLAISMNEHGLKAAMRHLVNMRSE
ncbi:MAG: hypothetical protein BMS9Abin25_1559 [Gammaproteobacteria bacterium]|nr:MAG: hypothetical protein BMS9Abin25_1559 [Gammaproteobacteria bacterium]